MNEFIVSMLFNVPAVSVLCFEFLRKNRNLKRVCIESVIGILAFLILIFIMDFDSYCIKGILQFVIILAGCLIIHLIERKRK